MGAPRMGCALLGPCSKYPLAHPFPKHSFFGTRRRVPCKYLCQQQSVCVNRIPPICILRRLKYPFVSWVHLVVVKLLLEARGQP